MVNVGQELRVQDDSVPMCLRGFDEKGLFGAGEASGDVVFDAAQVRRFLIPCFFFFFFLHASPSLRDRAHSSRSPDQTPLIEHYRGGFPLLLFRVVVVVVVVPSVAICPQRRFRQCVCPGRRDRRVKVCMKALIILERRLPCTYPSALLYSCVLLVSGGENVSKVPSPPLAPCCNFSLPS